MPVLLGLAGDLVADSNHISPTDWRVGGLVRLPTEAKFKDSKLVCRTCGQKLSLIIQIFDKEAKPGRIYLVFGCARRGCGRQDGSWRAFMLCHEDYQDLQLSPDQKRPTVNAWNLDWGSGDADWGDDVCGAPEGATQVSLQHLRIEQGLGDQGYTQPVDLTRSTVREDWALDHMASFGSPAEEDKDAGFGDLLTQLDSALTLEAKSPKPHTTQNLTADPCPDGDVDDGSQAESRNFPLPEFFLYAVEESETEAPFGSRDQQHINDLLERYQLEDTLPVQTINQSAWTADTSIWAGEKYEKTTVKGIDAAFLKFTKRLKRQPEQCLRLGGDFLWPMKAPPAVASANCKQCGHPLQCQLQLSPALMHMLEEAAQWLTQLGKGNLWTADWEWLTIAFFGCSNDCIVGQNMIGNGLAELHVAIANE